MWTRKDEVDDVMSRVEGRIQDKYGADLRSRQVRATIEVLMDIILDMKDEIQELRRGKKDNVEDTW